MNAAERTILRGLASVVLIGFGVWVASSADTWLHIVAAGLLIGAGVEGLEYRRRVK